MPASPRITATVANAMINAGIGDQANSGRLRLYSGTQPLAGGGAITSQVKLAEFIMASDAFPGASGGIITAAPITATVGLADGDATWYRLTKNDGTTVLIDGSVGLEGSPPEDSPDLIIDDIHIEVDEAVAVVMFQITMPLT